MKQRPTKLNREKKQIDFEKTTVLNGNEKLAAVKAALFTLLLFLAMTVQTGRMSMVLCALAFVSLIGKRPIARFRVRLCLSVVGLLAFMVLEGAAAIYSPFDTSAVSEYYRFLAAASLAVILLARYDREDVPGLLWGFAAVSAVIGAVSVDLVCDGPVYAAFNAVMEGLGATFNTVETAVGVQVSGIYNDANVTASLFALGTIVSLHLLGQAEENWKKKGPAALLLGVNALAFFLSMSRGAMLSFAVACLLWLVAAGKGRRLPLFFLMAFSAASTVALAIPASAHVISGDELPLLLLVVNGLVIFGLDTLLVRRLSALASAHIKAGAAMAVILVTACAVYGVAAFTVKGSYTFDESYVVTRKVTLTPGEYTLTAPLDEDIRVIVQGQTDYEKLTDESETLYDSSTGATTFTVPEGLAVTRFRVFAPPETVLDAITFSNGQTFRLGYPLLPAFAANRLLNGMGSSFSTRWVFDQDAVKIFLRAPIFGHGLGSTENLYRSVQMFQYESKYVHNHLLQTLCETGLVGGLAALSMMLGVGYLCISTLRKKQEGPAAVLLAVWIMMNLHSLMEINFSIRGYKCAAYALLMLPIILWAQPKKEARAAMGAALTAAFGLYLAVFGGLLESHRTVERQEYSTSSIYSYLDMLESCVNRDVFDRWGYELSYVANAVDLDSTKYTATMEKYVKSMRASGTYENCSGLARYYYLTKAQWDGLFACSREGVRQVRSSPDGWNLQMDFYRTEVLSAMGADNLDAFLDGVFALADDLDAMNGEEERLETVAFSEENQTFVDLCRTAREQGLSGQDAFALLSAQAAATEGEK